MALHITNRSWRTLALVLPALGILFRSAPRTCALALLVGLSALSVSSTQAQQQPLSLAEAEQRAIQHEPGQKALKARANALEERSVMVGQLPDPKLRMGMANFPLESGGFTTEGMTQAQIGIRQAFPPGKTRSISARQFQSLAKAMDRNADARGRDVLTSVRNAWLESYYWDRAHSTLSESRPFFSDLVNITRSLYAVGSKDQQDLLRAELELSRLDDRLIDIDRQRAGARAELAQWIGEEASRPLADKLPAWEQLPRLETLREALNSHPAITAADAQIEAQVAGIDLAKEQYKPGWALDLGYGYRDGMLSTAGSRSDFLSLSVTVDLPFFRKNRQDRGLAAALSERHAAMETKDELLRRLNRQLEAEYSRWRDLTRRVALYETRILGQAEDQANAALAAYQSEAGDFADVMRGFIDDLDTRLDHIRLQIERTQSYAVLANLGGLPQ